MRRFYFNVRTLADVAVDDVGVELETLEIARSEAKEMAREMLANAIKSNREPAISIGIMNERGDGLAAIALMDVLIDWLNTLAELPTGSRTLGSIHNVEPAAANVGSSSGGHH